MLSMVLGLFCGILWGAYPWGLGLTWPTLTGVSGVLGTGLFLWCRGLATYRPLGFAAGACVLGLCVTLYAGHCTAKAALPAGWIYHPVWVVGQVLDIPMITQGTIHHRLQLRSVNGQQAHQRLKMMGMDARLFTMQSGEIWCGWMQLRPPMGFHNPGGFNYVHWMWINHLQGQGFWLQGHGRAPPHRMQVAHGFIDRIRNHAVLLLHRAVTDPAAAGILLALGLGSEGGIDAASWQIFQRTGI